MLPDRARRLATSRPPSENQFSNDFRNFFFAGSGWLLALPEGLPDYLSGMLPHADHRALGSTCQRHRASWEASELKRLEGQPPEVAVLPLHQRQAFLQPMVLHQLSEGIAGAPRLSWSSAMVPAD